MAPVLSTSLTVSFKPAVVAALEELRRRKLVAAPSSNSDSSQAPPTQTGGDDETSEGPTPYWVCRVCGNPNHLSRQFCFMQVCAAPHGFPGPYSTAVRPLPPSDIKAKRRAAAAVAALPYARERSVPPTTAHARTNASGSRPPPEKGAAGLQPRPVRVSPQPAHPALSDGMTARVAMGAHPVVGGVPPPGAAVGMGAPFAMYSPHPAYHHHHHHHHHQAHLGPPPGAFPPGSVVYTTVSYAMPPPPPGPAVVHYAAPHNPFQHPGHAYQSFPPVAYGYPPPGVAGPAGYPQHVVYIQQR